MKYTKLQMIILIIVASSIIFGCAILFSQYHTKTITSFFDNDKNKISIIDITNGNNGSILSVDNKEVINNISSYLSKLKLKRVFDQPSSGWSYRFLIHEDNKEVLNITFNGDESCKINDIKYKIEKSTDITIEYLYNEAMKAGK